MSICDLHTHSTASDGQYTPSELVGLAKAWGLEVLAVTDHDTLDGVAEAVRAGKELGVRVLPGIELSAKEYHTFHILGYGVAPDAPALAELCRRMRNKREERKGLLLDFLQEKGMELTAAEVEENAGGDIIGRPHFAQAMVRRGYVTTNREAFDRYLDTEEYHERIAYGKPPVRECIGAIRAAGGRASLAHPYQIGIEDGELDRLAAELAGYGLEAIECYYPRHTPEQEAFYLSLAQKYHLHVTGGSDFHGEKVKPGIELSRLELELDWLMENG